MTKRLVIDTDTGSDDAIALMLAAHDPDVMIEAVTTVAGNVPLDLATRNALFTLELMGCDDVPVYKGCDRPLLRPLETAQSAHGKDGMGDLGLAPPAGAARQGHAVDILRKLSLEHPGELTLITLGPLTNVAAALARDPELLARFDRTYIMGGAPDGMGNATAVAEYNVWADPEAAAMTLAAPGAKTIVGWDVSRKYTVVGPEQRRVFEEIGTDRARFALDINRVLDRVAREYNGLEGFHMPDQVTMAVALDPSLVTGAADMYMGVTTADETRGFTFVDVRKSEAPPPNVTLIQAVDQERFMQLIYDMCRAG